jgi:hypothetical protein
MSFSSATPTQPGKFLAALPDLVTKWVNLHDQGTPVALCHFVFGYDFTIVHEFCGHALWINYFDVIAHRCNRSSQRLQNQQTKPSSRLYSLTWVKSSQSEQFSTPPYPLKL